MNKKTIIYLFLFFLIAAISLSPRLPFGQISNGRSIDIRVEDILLCIGFISLVSYIIVRRRSKIVLPPLFWPILTWGAFGIVSVLFNLAFKGLPADKAFFYFAKEIEFFLLYFIVFYFIKDTNTNKFLSKSWMLFGVINIAWVFYTVFSGSQNYYPYGPNTFMEPKGPFPSGGFFLMLFIFFFNIFIFYYDRIKISNVKKIFILVLSVIPAIGVISSGSRASTVGLFASLVISYIIYVLDKVDLVRLVRITILVASLAVIFLLIIYFMPFNDIKRVLDFNHMASEYTSDTESSRIGILKSNIYTISTSPEVSALGLGVYGEAHGQYLRVVLERGFLGLFIFLWLIYSILKTCWRSRATADNFKKALVCGLLASTAVMLIMSIPNDPFMVVKIAEPYWFFVAMTMAAIFTLQRDNAET